MTEATTGGAIRTIDAGSYAIHIAAGLRRDFVSHVIRTAKAHRYAVVTDDRVGPHYANDLFAALASHGTTSVHVMASGESNKTRETWADITDQMLAVGCARDTTVIALGGGVVGDLAGFVAATFMRGIPVVQCPTSLLAMIDASVGGKTGADTAAGKNLVGAFHAPAVVLADVEMLRTLPLEHRRAGLAEAIKHAVIADASYLGQLDSSLGALLAGDPPASLAIVARSVEIKASIVSQDAREHGRRKTLNFGHTLGHAIERATGYALLHGECVAIGMVLEARLAERIGVAEPGTAAAVEEVLRHAGLPIARPASIDSATVLEATRRDKKVRGGEVEYALPAQVGQMAAGDGSWAIPVADALVLEVLA